MTYKQLETSREIRQWIKTIGTIIVGVNFVCPDAKYLVRDKFKEVRQKITK